MVADSLRVTLWLDAIPSLHLDPVQCVAKPASPPFTLKIVLAPVGQGAPGIMLANGYEAR
jgi:hypothetical protein